MANPLQLSLVSFKQGAYIIVEGKQQADCFYIIHSGKVRISKEAEIVEEEENVWGPGDFFGVVSTMSSHSHIETAIALTDVNLISVHRDQFGPLIEKNTPVAIKIIQQFAKRMRFLDESLAQLTFKGTASEHPSHLFRVGEYYAHQNNYNQAYYAYYRYLQYCPNDENVPKAKERLTKIKPYAKAVYLDVSSEQFTRSYPKDTMIFSENEPGAELYIIQKGTVKISKIVNDKEVLIALLPSGDIFGEMALLENKPRSASAIAHDGVTLLAVNRSNFQKMIQGQPQLITRLTILLSERIWFIYNQLANTLIKDPLGRLYDYLWLQLEKNRIPISRGSSYTFEFGPKELVNMVGLSAAEGSELIKKLFENKRLKMMENKIYTSDVEEIKKQAEYYKKMQKIVKARKDRSQQK